MLENNQLSYVEVYKTRNRSHSSGDCEIVRYLNHDAGKCFDTYRRRWQQVTNNIDKDIRLDQCLTISPTLKRANGGSSFDNIFHRYC